MKAVSEKIDLGFPTAEAVKELQEITTITPLRGSGDFIEITVKHESRLKAALIANTIAEVSIKHGREIMISRAQRVLVALDDELAAQEKLVEQHKQELANLIQQSGAPPRDWVDQTLDHSQYLQAKEAYEKSRAILRDLKIRQQESRTLLKDPGDPVTLHEKAK